MKNKQYGGGNRREHFRIEYPLLCRPIITVLNQKCKVIDISEHGIRFTCNNGHALQPGLEVKARITFNDGTSLNVEGKILRVDESEAVIYLPIGIPFGRIVTEQMFLK